MLKKSIVAVIYKVFVAILSYLTIAFCVRQYDSASSSVLLFYISSLNFCSIFLRFGTDNLIVRLMNSSYKERQSLVLSSVLVIFFIQVIFCYTVGYFLLDKIPLPSIDRHLFLALLFFFSIIQICSFAFQAKNKLLSFYFFQSVVFYLPISALMFLEYPVLELVKIMIYILAPASLVALVSVIIQTSHTRFTIYELSHNVGYIYKRAINLFVASLSQSILGWGVLMILPIYLTLEEYEAFAFSQRTVLSVSFILGAVTLAFSPRFASLYHERDISTLKKLLRKIWVLTLISVLICILVLFFCFESLISYVGLELNSVIYIFVILLFGQCVNALSGPVGSLLVMTGHEVFHRNTTLVCMVFLFILLVPASLMFSGVGAALIVALTVCIQNFLNLYKSKRVLSER